MERGVRGEIRRLTRFATGHDYAFVKAVAGYTDTALYVDNGYSAHDTERPGLDKLNADITVGRVGVVLAKDHSRFWRDAARGMAWLARMDKLGVTVLCADTGGGQWGASELQADKAKP